MQTHWCLSLAVLLLSGCVPGPASATLAPAATPTPGPTAAPTASPVTTSPPAPAATGTPTATPKPISSAPAGCCGPYPVVTGTVFDEAGAPVDGALVRVTSLDASVSYRGSTTTAAGKWVINNIPRGLNVELVASKDGWTSRRRVGSYDIQANQQNVVNFDGAYFISSYPEVARVEHKPGSVVFTLSETLDDVNRRRFEDNLRLVPPGGKDPLTPRLTWDPTGTIATAILEQDLTGYNAVLLAGQERVRDPDNNPMGTDGQNAFNGPLAPTDRVSHVFRNESPTSIAGAFTPDLRWAATHSDWAPL
ncbi:MAG: hypothetical protein JWM80_5316 [Cyanobacteria bacterium RYN_339]|nr:hypothetical protein [Cyanobacteria bacterium RYN_339]